MTTRKKDKLNYRRIAAFIKKIILNIFNDEEIYELIDKKIISRYQNYKTRGTQNKREVYQLSLVVALITALLAWDGVHSQLAVAKAENDIKQDVRWMRRIDSAIMDMRGYAEKARLASKRGERLDVSRLNDERLEYQKELVKAYAGSSSVIGQDLDSSNSLLNKYDESVKNILSKKAPKDDAWQLYLIRSNCIIRLKIRKEEQEIKRAQSFILTRLLTKAKSLLFHSNKRSSSY